jgi:hypothetical protein
MPAEKGKSRRPRALWIKREDLAVAVSPILKACRPKTVFANFGMLRGFVYSPCAVCLFLLASIGWITLQQPSEETMYLMSGWLLLISFFAVGPLFFALGYWHHWHLHPKEPHWDAETGE